jgi:hypothetical protein
MKSARRGALSLVVVLALGGVAGAKPTPAPDKSKPNPHSGSVGTSASNSL